MICRFRYNHLNPLNRGSASYHFPFPWWPSNFLDAETSGLHRSSHSALTAVCNKDPFGFENRKHLIEDLFCPEFRLRVWAKGVEVNKFKNLPFVVLKMKFGVSVISFSHSQL